MSVATLQSGPGVESSIIKHSINHHNQLRDASGLPKEEECRAKRKPTEAYSSENGHPSGPAAPTYSSPPPTRLSLGSTQGSAAGGSPFALAACTPPVPSTRAASAEQRYGDAAQDTPESNSASEDSSREGSCTANLARSKSIRRKPSNGKKSARSTPRRYPSSGGEEPTQRADVKSLKLLLGNSMSRLDQLESDKQDRYERYKNEAIEHGLKMMEEERKRSDQEHSILVKRIAFLTQELEEARRAQSIKTRECEELLEVAEELARERGLHLDESSLSEASSIPRNWLQSPDTSIVSSPEKVTPTINRRECRACGIGSFFAGLGL